jgi:predicted PurR-regulated permease PerM
MVIMMPKKIEISHRTILFTLAVLAGSWLVLQIRDILYLLFIALILTTAIRPLVDRLVRFRLPRVLVILLLYVLLIGGISIVIGSMIPTIGSQSSRFITDLPSTIEKLAPSFGVNLRALTQEFAPLTQNILMVGVGIVTNIVTVVTILVFTFYFLLGVPHLEPSIEKFFGSENSKKLLNIMNDVENRLGAWARGQILLMVTIGVFVYIGLTLLRMDYALPLAVLAGMLEVIPMAGPIISAVPAVLFALTISPLFALSVAALYFVIQQFENHLIVPYVMRKSVGLSPVLTIVALMIGGRFEGIVGALLAVPAILVVQVILTHITAPTEKESIKAS